MSETDAIWWVVEGKLGGFRKPTLNDLEMLNESNVGGIVSLLDDEENLDMYKSSNIPYQWIPVKGGKCPSMEQLNLLKTFVNQQNEAKKAAIVHCTNGRRRTGTAMIATLIMSGYSVEDAKSLVYGVKPDVDLREEQIAFLDHLPASL